MSQIFTSSFDYKLDKDAYKKSNTCQDCGMWYAFYPTDTGCPYCKAEEKEAKFKGKHGHLPEYGKLDAILAEGYKKSYVNLCSICGINYAEGSSPFCGGCYQKSYMQNQQATQPISLDIDLSPNIDLMESLKKSQEEGDYAKEHAYEKAGELGLEVVEPDNNVLLIDLDTKEQEEDFYKRLTMLKNLEDGKEQLLLDTLETVSKSGKKHVYIRINKALKPMTRIGLQAILGSDPMREVLSLRRVLNGGLINTVLFETPEEYEKVKKWLNPVCSVKKAVVNKPKKIDIDEVMSSWVPLSKVDFSELEKSINDIQEKVDSALASVDTETTKPLASWATLPLSVMSDISYWK